MAKSVANVVVPEWDEIEFAGDGSTTIPIAWSCRGKVRSGKWTAKRAVPPSDDFESAAELLARSEGKLAREDDRGVKHTESLRGDEMLAKFFPDTATGAAILAAREKAARKAAEALLRLRGKSKAEERADGTLPDASANGHGAETNGATVS